MNPLQELNARASGSLVDPWMYADPAAHPVAPCRSVEITAEFRAKDAQRQARASGAVSAEATAWRERLQLNPENLRVVRTAPATALRQADTRQLVVDRVPRTRVRGQRLLRVGVELRPCAGDGCNAGLVKSVKGDFCAACRSRNHAARRAARTCACGIVMQGDASKGMCRKCLRAAKVKHVPLRLCGRGCGRGVRPNNAAGVCFACKGKEKKRAQLAEQVKCASVECERMLRRGRTEGFCKLCRKGKHTGDWQRRRNERLGKHCADCGLLMSYKSQGSYCRVCAGHRKACRTVLVAASQGEYELDQTWAALGLEDKDALMAYAAGESEAFA
jgi:hypothetical protein